MEKNDALNQLGIPNDGGVHGEAPGKFTANTFESITHLNGDNK